MLRLKLVLLLTEILQNHLVLKKQDVFYISAIPEVTWYEPLYNTIHFQVIVFKRYVYAGFSFKNPTRIDVSQNLINQPIFP